MAKKCGGGVPTDMKSLLKWGAAHGWTVTPTGSGHLKWTNPKAWQFVITSSTPSNQNAFKFMCKDLIKALDVRWKPS